MSDINKPSLASAGSQPVAWMVEWTDHIDLFRSRSCAEYVASGDVKVQPLYRSPTLTDEEREAIERLCEAVAEYSDIDRKANGCHADDDMAAVDVARGLLKRLT
jgi:hypothetical protein